MDMSGESKCLVTVYNDTRQIIGNLGLSFNEMCHKHCAINDERLTLGFQSAHFSSRTNAPLSASTAWNSFKQQVSFVAIPCTWSKSPLFISCATCVTNVLDGTTNNFYDNEYPSGSNQSDFNTRQHSLLAHQTKLFQVKLLYVWALFILVTNHELFLHQR